MLVREGKAVWTDNLVNGEGTLKSQALEASLSFASRFENGEGVSPEELIGNAHAGCYSMALANELDQAGYTPVAVRSTAKVHFDPEGLAIEEVELRTEATVDDIDEQTFQEIARAAKEGCPVSKALAGTDITLGAARLEN